MSRLRFNCEKRPIVIIEFTDDLAETIKPRMEELFGVKFLAAETKHSGEYHYEFEADEKSFDVFSKLVAAYYEKKIVKSIEIDIDLN